MSKSKSMPPRRSTAANRVAIMVSGEIRTALKVLAAMSGRRQYEVANEAIAAYLQTVGMARGNVVKPMTRGHIDRAAPQVPSRSH